VDSITELEIIQKLPLEKQYELIENSRKDWTESEKAKIQELLRNVLEKQKTPGARTDLTSAKHLAQVKKPKDGRVDAQIGKILGDSHETVRKRSKIFDEINKNPAKWTELKESLDSNKVSISTAHARVADVSQNLPKVSIPKGQWNVLELDFPWGYKDSAGSRHRATSKLRYPTESPETILKKYVPKFAKIVADDAVLFMWVTVPLLNEIIQLRILENLGFEYKTMISWHKLIPKETFGGIGMGHWFAGEMEHCMVGVKGNINHSDANCQTILRSQSSGTLKNQ